MNSIFIRAKSVSNPTIMISDQVRRIDIRDIAYDRAARGEYGPVVQRAVGTKLPEKYPISAAQKDLIDHISNIDMYPVSETIAPISHDPDVLTRHIKDFAHFMKADQVRICEVPAWAFYSHDRQGKAIEPRFQTAIVVVMRKYGKTMRASTGSDWIGDPISFQAYQHLGLVAEIVANYIRRLGWEASAQ